MPAKIILNNEQEQQLKEAFHSDIAMSALPYDYRVVNRYWSRWFTKEEREERRRRLSAIGKIGQKNPMYGKKGKLHHNAKGTTVSTQGYPEVWAPSWYTGKAYGGRVLEHILVWCEHNGYTEVPDGWVVHHLDHSRDNNHPDNLLLMTIGDHLAYHNTKDPVRATTILQRSRQKALPKRSPSL